MLTVFSLLAILLLAQRSRASTAAELAAEQANARRDQLTGAANRRAFEEAMTAEHSRVVRGAVPAGLFIVDLDRFKSVNDRFGHAVGDEVLIEVVRRLSRRACGRPTSSLAGAARRSRCSRRASRADASWSSSASGSGRWSASFPFATSTSVLPVTVSVGGTLLDGSVPPATAFAAPTAPSTTPSAPATDGDHAAAAADSPPRDRVSAAYGARLAFGGSR